MTARKRILNAENRGLPEFLVKKLLIQDQEIESFLAEVEGFRRRTANFPVKSTISKVQLINKMSINRTRKPG